MTGAGVLAFQSTPLREGRHANNFFDGISLMFQSTPLREGRLLIHVHKSEDEEVSIHAPA